MEKCILQKPINEENQVVFMLWFRIIKSKHIGKIKNLKNDLRNLN